MPSKLDVARGDRLCAAMEGAGVSSRELAEQAGVSAPTVTHWRKGGEIRNAHLVAICPCLAISIDYLLTGAEGPEQDELQMLRDYRELGPMIRQSLRRLAHELAECAKSGDTPGLASCEICGK